MPKTDEEFRVAHNQRRGEALQLVTTTLLGCSQFRRDPEGDGDAYHGTAKLQIPKRIKHEETHKKNKNCPHNSSFSCDFNVSTTQRESGEVAILAEGVAKQCHPKRAWKEGGKGERTTTPQDGLEVERSTIHNLFLGTKRAPTRAPERDVDGPLPNLANWARLGPCFCGCILIFSKKI